RGQGSPRPKKLAGPPPEGAPLVLAVLLAAGARAAAPTSPRAPSQPAAAAPTAASAPSKPAAAMAASAATGPAAAGDWQAEWNKLLAAAKQEGKVVVAGPPGDLFRQAALGF